MRLELSLITTGWNRAKVREARYCDLSSLSVFAGKSIATRAKRV